ncbi:hypothetical protein C5167_015184, partial [Papaver somniferum]
ELERLLRGIEEEVSGVVDVRPKKKDTPQVVPIWKAKVGGSLCKKEDPAMFWLTQLSGLMHSIYIQVPEEVLGNMGAPPKTDVPIITPNNHADADGLIFGFPTRFGMIEAQFKAFLDTQGVESNHSVIHHGLIYLPIGLTFEAGMFEMVQEFLLGMDQDNQLSANLDEPFTRGTTLLALQRSSKMSSYYFCCAHNNKIFYSNCPDCLEELSYLYEPSSLLESEFPTVEEHNLL